MKRSIQLKSEDVQSELKEILKERNVHKILLVCGKSYQKLPVKKIFQKLGVPIIYFTDFKTNPQYESVEKGVQLLQREDCDFVAAVGGGSAMDIAKCIKLFAVMEPGEKYLNKEPIENGIPLLVVPTTAGTGSEATQFAVIYDEGKKKSVEHESILPDYVWLEPEVLETLPLYQKKVTMLDALCHSIESYWSVQSNEKSKQLAADAIREILENKEGYLQNTKRGNMEMLHAANLAGQAINITRTTAAHAMSYKLTTLYDIPHGQAVALILPVLWRYMLEEPIEVRDIRGKRYLQRVFQKLATCLGADTPLKAVEKFENFIREMELGEVSIKKEDLELLVSSVNVERLNNHPVLLTKETIKMLYMKI